MPVVIGVAGEGDVEAVLDVEQALHRVRRRRVHADPAVPVGGHEAEGLVDLLADDGEVEPVVLGDARPVVHAGAAERVDAHLHLGIADRGEVDDVAEVGDVGAEVVVPVRRRRAQRLRRADALHARHRLLEQAVRRRLAPAR